MYEYFWSPRGIECEKTFLRGRKYSHSLRSFPYIARGWVWAMDPQEVFLSQLGKPVLGEGEGGLGLGPSLALMQPLEGPLGPLAPTLSPALAATKQQAASLEG